MRALVMRGFGPPNTVQVGEVPTPTCGPGDVLIKVVAAGVNPVDWKECEGFLERFYGGHSEPWIPGYDAAGFVEKVGREVAGFRPGDRVVAFSDRRENGHNGTFAEYVRVLAHAVTKVPDNVTLAEAAAVPTASITGYQALFRENKGNLKSGDRVLIHGASGGVGSFTVQFAKASGLEVAAACSARNVEYVRSLGADLVLDYAKRSLAAAVRRWRPEGVDAVVDCVSGGTLPDALDMLRSGGRLMSIATLNEDGDIEGDAERAAQRGFKKIWSIMDQARIDQDLAEILDLMSQGKVKAPPLEIHSLDEGAAVLQRMKTGGVRGKMVFSIFKDEPRAPAG
jgi:NADPH:quinone reductase-like Zn-dependent oxidoreductase